MALPAAGVQAIPLSADRPWVMVDDDGRAAPNACGSRSTDLPSHPGRPRCRPIGRSDRGLPRPVSGVAARRSDRRRRLSRGRGVVRGGAGTGTHGHPAGRRYPGCRQLRAARLPDPTGGACRAADHRRAQGRRHSRLLTCARGRPDHGLHGRDHPRGPHRRAAVMRLPHGHRGGSLQRHHRVRPGHRLPVAGRVRACGIERRPRPVRGPVPAYAQGSGAPGSQPRRRGDRHAGRRCGKRAVQWHQRLHAPARCRG